MQQVAGLSQLAGDLMIVSPVVIDLGWGALKSAIVKQPAADRETQLPQYIAAFRHVEAGALDRARAALKPLATAAPLAPLVEAQLAKLSPLAKARGDRELGERS